MMTKRLALIVTLVFIAAVAFGGCATMGKPTAQNFQAPKVTLVSFEVPQYDEYWYFAASVQPTKGKAGDRGAFLPMSFLFDVHNPNDFPVLLDGITYTVAFDKDFEVITTNVNDLYWIPANKTSQVRVSTLITVRSALTGLLLANATALKTERLGCLGNPREVVDRSSRPVRTRDGQECSIHFQGRRAAQGRSLRGHSPLIFN
jgi:hypothetical protein